MRPEFETEDDSPTGFGQVNMEIKTTAGSASPSIP